MTPQRVAILVIVATLGVLLLLLLFYGRPRRAAQEPIPQNFAKGDPDAVLEGPRLRSVQVWGVASSIFILGFLVVYFVREPFREAQYDKKFLQAAIDRGEIQFKPDATLGQTGANCASCHGPDGGGGFAATDTTWPAPPLKNEFYRYTRDEITRIIQMGRPGTPMPAWAVKFGGPLNDQMIDDIVDYLATIQVKPADKYELAKTVTKGADVFAQKCAVCHGTNAHGQALGQPLPTFFAPDLTTEFYRMGVRVARDDVTTKLLAKLNRTPTKAEIDKAFAALSTDEILKAGEEAARNTITKGRLNTPMPAWQNRIMPSQIDAVLQYLRSIQRVPA